jgi:hypothetical protein
LKETDISEVHTASTIALMEAVCTSETLVYFNHTIGHYIPEICYLQPHYHTENWTAVNVTHLMGNDK